MSDAPISAADEDGVVAAPVDEAALARAGWHNAELVWEQIQETAAASVLAGNLADACELWLGGLEVAAETLADDDPRLGTSLANAARGRAVMGDAAEAAALYERARDVWSRCDAWVAGLAPERRARSSLFHLRLESKHRGGYEHLSRQRYHACVEEARTHLAVLAGGAAPDHARLARWQAEKPPGLCDERRLLGACLLLA